MTVMAAASREGKKINDVVSFAGNEARKAIAAYGADKVINATIGCYAGEDEVLGCLPVVEKLYRSFPIRDFTAYAPPVGLDAYRQAAISETFEDQRPEGYIDAIATAGGTGAVHIAIANYSEMGDSILVADWRWSIYEGLSNEVGRSMKTFALLDSNQAFNIESFSSAVADLLSKQDSLLIILNTPANNPTGFSLSEQDWTEVLDVCRFHEKQGKRITILVDIAYIAYAGEKNEVRKFMKQFSNLPKNIFVLVAYSMSKGYTLYGQRAGALVGVSSSKDVIDEFVEVAKYSARTAWSNVNRAAMTLLIKVRGDKALQEEIDKERRAFYDLIEARAAIFMEEAKECGLRVVPFQSGFFIAIPVKDSTAVCRELQKELIFGAPVDLGVRLGVCSVPKVKMKGLAAKIKKAIQAVDQL